MNLAIYGIEADLGKFNADTFFNDCHPQLRADFIMANLPFNLSGWGQDKLLEDVRWAYGIRPWECQLCVAPAHDLAPGGRIGMVLPNGSLSSQSDGEGEIRKNIQRRFGGVYYCHAYTAFLYHTDSGVLLVYR